MFTSPEITDTKNKQKKRVELANALAAFADKSEKDKRVDYYIPTVDILDAMWEKINTSRISSAVFDATWIAFRYGFIKGARYMEKNAHADIGNGGC